MGKREIDPRLQKLWDDGEKVFSYSKINSLNGCLYDFYLSYLLKERSPNNIWGIMGGVVHDDIESYYHGDITLEDAKKNLQKKVIESELVGVTFPEETHKDNYMKNIFNFYDNHVKMKYLPKENTMMTEVFCLYQTPNTKQWIQMYIDVLTMDVTTDEDGKKIPVFQIGDWKTSAKFDKKKLQEAKNQLVLYALGIEEQTGHKVDKVYWNMLKYYRVTYNVKLTNKTTGIRSISKRVASPLIERRKLVSTLQDKIYLDLLDYGMSEVVANMEIAKAVQSNDMSNLPQEVQNFYKIEDGIVVHELTEESKQETIKWVEDSIDALNVLCQDDEHKDIKNYALIEHKFPPTTINDKTSFFCNNLCRGMKCKHYKEYVNIQKEKEKKAKELKYGKLDVKLRHKQENQLDKLFGEQPQTVDKKVEESKITNNLLSSFF